MAVDAAPDASVEAQVQSLAALQPSEAMDQQAAGKGDLVASGRPSSVQLTYTMVLDVEITLQAAQQQLLRSILAKHGIQIAKTVVVNDSIQAALNRMRHTVPSESLPSVSELYWVHAPVQLLDQAVLEIQTTVDQFPVCRFDLAFETPAASLSQAIAASADLTSDSSSIAIPVATEADRRYRESPFESVAYQGTLVTASRRQSSEIINHHQIPVVAGQGSLLLLVRQP